MDELIHPFFYTQNEFLILIPVSQVRTRRGMLNRKVSLSEKTVQYILKLVQEKQGSLILINTE